MTAECRDYQVILVCRSDGCDAGPGYWPAPEIKNTTSASIPGGENSTEKPSKPRPHMVRLEENDVRFAEWRIKLGMLLKQELAPDPEAGLPWYVQFPRGYWLYEKSKHLLVSGYPTKPKLFKTAQEFAIHLIWLLSTSSDWQDCRCMLCNPAAVSAAAASPVSSIRVANPPTSASLLAARDSSLALNSYPTIDPSLSLLPPKQQAIRQTGPSATFSTATFTNTPGTPSLGASSASGFTSSLTTSAAHRFSPTVSQSPKMAYSLHAQSQGRHASFKSQTPKVLSPPVLPPTQAQALAKGLVRVPAKAQSQTHSQARFSPTVASTPASLTSPPAVSGPTYALSTSGLNARPASPASLSSAGPSRQIKYPSPATNSSLVRPAAWPIPSSPLFRVGELVWFGIGNTWRLGVVGSVTGPSTAYDIVPIGHGLVPQPNVTKTAPMMRPFYAFSLPPVVLPELKQPFDSVPWEALLRTADRSQREHLLLDASKTAAAKVDWSYSLFAPLDDGKGPLAHFGGIFLGAERIELGDSVRVRATPLRSSPASSEATATSLDPLSDGAALGLREIFTSQDRPGAIFFRGPEFRLAQPGDTILETHLPVMGDQLPLALREEALWRVKLASSRQASSPGAGAAVWVQTGGSVLHEEASVRGRFYPTPRLMPILNPTAYQVAVVHGRVDDAYACINNRMESSGTYLGRRRNRLDCLGVSVSHSVPLAFEPHVKEEAEHGHDTEPVD